MIVEAVARLCGLFDALARGEAVSRHDLLAALASVVSASFEFDSLAVAGEFPALDPAERRALEHALERLVASYRFYWRPLDVVAVRGEPELGCGDLVDDLADIHADLAPGWRAHLGGAPLADVLGAWACLRSHWLDHAVDALWVLHQVDPT